jgi:phosphohistidine swiveling domain-containing protein
VTLEPAVPPSPNPEPRIDEIAPGISIQFGDPKLASLTWERDAVHMPASLSPLASDYALVLGNSLNEQYPLRSGGFPQRWHAAVWHGYVYYAFERNATDAEWPAIQARIDLLCSERALVTESYWDNEVLPELRAIYARIDAIDAANLSEVALADAWESSWRDAERAWQLHMDVTPAVYRLREELVKMYVVAVPDASRVEANRLLQGFEHELHEMDRAMDELAELAAATPAVREALRSGTRSLGTLEGLAGGAAFVEAVNAALAIHGHVGQLADDLEMPSFGEEPELYLSEIAKRLDGPTVATEARRLRLRREADEVAERARSALSTSTDTLARFDATLALAARIGPLSERHNYWIDRAVLAHLRRLAIRVGSRLVRDGVIERPTDIFYLHRAEVGNLLRKPQDQAELVKRRRAEHDADARIKPASTVGVPASLSNDRPHFTSAERDPGDASFRGTGASPGVARGRARVVLDVGGFARVHQGDIIVCYASNPSFVPILSIAAGLIATVGGILSHGAVVAREFGVPAVVGVADATTRIPDGQDLEIDGTTGTIQLL